MADDETKTVIVVRDTAPLASVQTVHTPKSIAGRDQIVTATVQGYVVVVNKAHFFSDPNVFPPRALCVFFQPDSLLDAENDEFKFLESKKGRLVATKKMFGVYSQGLCMPLDIVKRYGLDPSKLTEGQDLTSALKVTKYVSEEEDKAQYRPNSHDHAPFPTNEVPKTDELNLQTYTEFLDRMVGRKVAITMKADGSSTTVTSNGKICGRNYEWTAEDKSNAAYFEVDKKYNIRETIKGTGFNVQGELCGPKIQGNPLGLKENHFFVFNIYKDGKYLPHAQVTELCQKWGFEVVPTLYSSVEVMLMKTWNTVEEWLAFADDQVYPVNKKPAEGLVVKSVDDKEPRISFKVMSRKYLLRNK